MVLVINNPPANIGRRCKTCRFSPRVGKIPWRRAWHPTPVFLPGKFHGQRSLVVHGVAEPDMTERLRKHRNTALAPKYRHVYMHGLIHIYSLVLSSERAWKQ